MENDNNIDKGQQALAHHERRNDPKLDCEDEHSSALDASSLEKADSGITLSCKSEDICEDDGDGSCISSPIVVRSVQDATSDVDMSNDFAESLNDSAIPSASSILSECSAFEASSSKDDKEEEVSSMCKDESLSVDSCLESEKSVEVSSSDIGSGKKKKIAADSPQLTDSSQEGKSGGKFKHKNNNKSENSDGKNGAAAEGGIDNENTVKEDSLSSLTSSEDENCDDEDKDSDNVTSNFFSSRLFGRRKRRLRNRRDLDLNLDSSSSEEEENVDENGEDNDENEEDDDDDDIQHTDSTTDSDIGQSDEISKITSEILNKSTPKPNWFALHELRQREYGYSRRQSLSSFNEKVQGSILMAQRLRLVDTMKYHEGCVNSLCFNRTGTLLASGSDDLNVVLWNWQRGCPSLIYDSGHRSNVFQAKFMPFSGDCHVVSCARDGQVRLAELSLTGVCKATRKLVQHKGAAHKLALEYDSPNVFLSCGEDAVTYLFDLREERPHRLVTTKENDKKVALYSIHSNPADSQQFCVGGKDHFIRIYDKRKIAEDVDGGVFKKLCPDHLVSVDNSNKPNVTCACYNYNGTEILGSYNDEDIYLFDNTHSEGANFVHRYRGHRNNATVKGVNFYGPKSEFVVSGSDCGNLYIWDKQTESIINFCEGDKAGVINVLEPHPCLPVLATSGLDHEVKLWMPSQGDHKMDMARLKKTINKNQRDQKLEWANEPTILSGRMLWMMMHHFRNTARRRLREEGQELSTSEEDDENISDDSEEGTTEMNQCAQS